MVAEALAGGLVDFPAIMRSMQEELLTERLRLRPWKLDDLVPLADIFAKPEVWRFPFGRGFSPVETKSYLDRRIELQARGILPPSAVEERKTGRLLGYLALSPPDWLPEVMPAFEIGWRLDPPYWGKGLATEGARVLLDYGFRELELPEVLSIYEPANVASGRVMEKLGLLFDHESRHPYFGTPIHIHRLTRSEWERTQESVQQ